ncbi:MAG: hypothetical protein AWU58_486 [Methanohalophilus sp. T328-1]|jgi:hypothetical protein|nr:MAG: hypothetical protein AWU58_486 [Methanohalophilus sp. T328-1]
MPYREESEWEYKVDKIDENDFQSQLNDYGSSKWELITIHDNEIILKRKVITQVEY